LSLQIEKYENKYKIQWNTFLQSCKNRHFFFNRDYLEYHADRFTDFSLMFFNKNNLVALFPANIIKKTVYTHQGLTFGGLLINESMHTDLMIEIFDKLIRYLDESDVDKFIYKCIPYIYHTNPAEEDRYALFLNDALLITRNVSATISLDQRIKYQERRSRSIRKAVNKGITIENQSSLSEYWPLLESTLKAKHGTVPTHNLREINLLQSRFPRNIKLFTAKLSTKIIAGVLVYENEHITHTQYLASNDIGRETGALDLIIDHLISNIYPDKKYFDFGVSNEDSGRHLNTGLSAYKEGFGARSIAHDIYEINIK